MKRVLRTPSIPLMGAFMALLFGAFQPVFAAPGDILFSDDFERNNLNPTWTRSNNQNAGIGTYTANSGTRSLYTRWGAVAVTSNAIDLSAVPAAELSMWIRIGDDVNFNFSEWPDSAGEDLLIQYLDSASGWVTLETFIGGAYTAGAIYNRTYTLPTTAMHANFQIRVSQNGGSGNDFDYYHVDDVVLTEVTPPPPVAFGSCDDFENGLSNWTITPNGGVAAIAVGVDTVNSPTHALYLANGRVYVTSTIIDTSAATSPYLTLWVRRGQDNLDGYSEYPETGEDLQIQYLDSGNNWVLLDTIPGGGTAGEILNLSYALPANAIHANFRVRLYQTNGSGVGWDYWHVDDVCVSTPSSGSLVAYYTQDEAFWNGTAGEVLDSSGNGLHGTALSGLSTAPAQVCRGANFNGSNGPVEIADNALLDISSDLSASAWIQPNSLPGSGLMSILSKDTNYEFHITSSGEINWWWNDSTGTVRQLTTSGANVTPGNWYHVAITYTSGQQRIYVNGVQRASSSFTGNLITNSNPLNIGGDQGYAGRQFNGLIDEVRIYAAAQSQAEVIVDMNATHPCPVTPVAEYHLDETSWGVVTDSSGSGNDGSTSGTVTPTITSPAIAGDPGTCGYADVPTNTTITPADAIDSGLDVDTAIGNQGTISFWYKSNVPWINSGDRQLFDATNAATGDYFYLVLQSDRNGRGRLRFEMLDDANNRLRARTPDLNIAANTWTHIAVTWDLSADTASIYINGALSDTNNRGTSGVLGNMDTLFFGDNRSTDLGRNGTANSANGSFDEIRIYNLVQTAAQITADMNATHACNASQVHHYRIVHDGSGLTCNPETVTVQACMDAACTSFYPSAVSGTLTPSTTAFSITDGSGIAPVAFRNNSAGTITLGITGTSPAATNATTCLMDDGVTTSASCDMTFHDAGFVFDVPNLTSCATSANVTISAVRKDLTTQQCVPAFSNRNETLKFWSSYVTPATGTQSVAVNGANVAVASPGTDVTLSFDASGQSSITVAYPDAGDVQLNASYTGATGSADEGLVMTGNDRFVAVPAKFIVNSGDANAACATGDATCSAFTQAGAAFSLDVSAACADNTVTPNFIATGINLGHNLIAPVGGVAGTLGNGSIDIVDADNGSATINNQSIDEVGVFTITATLDSYLGITATPGTNLIVGDSSNIGRFYPAGFNVTHNHNPACGLAGPTPFTYAGLNGSKSGQPFAVDGTITARNTAGNPTLNYIGGFARLTSLQVTATPLSAVGGGALGWTVDPLNFANGFSNFTATGNYSFNSILPPALGPQSVYLRITADDNEANGSEEDNTKTVEYRFGRLQLVDAYGPQSSDLSMPVVAQYHNGADFISNPDDSCTLLPAIGAGGISLDPLSWTANLQPGDTFISATSGMLANGLGNITLSAPGPGAGADLNDGSVDVILDVTTIPWLSVDSDSDGNYAENPVGTATFGIYRGDDRFLFWQE